MIVQGVFPVIYDYFNNFAIGRLEYFTDYLLEASAQYNLKI